MNSVPTETSTYRSQPAGSPQKSPPIWLISPIFLLGLLVLGLAIGRTEIARWYFASTANAIADNRFEDAIDSASQGLRWNPQYSELIDLRAAARMAQGDFDGALADYDQLIAAAGEAETRNDASIRPLERKANVLMRVERYAEAIALMGEVVEYRRDQYDARDDYESRELFAWSLNNRAYMQAQARMDLAEALRDVEEAVKLRQPQEAYAMIDTLGYLQLLNDEHDLGLENLEIAVRDAAEERNLLRGELQQRMQQVEDQRPYEAELKRIDENFAILLHHRGEGYQMVGEEARAKADLEKAVRLGYNPAQGVW